MEVVQQKYVEFFDRLDSDGWQSAFRNKFGGLLFSKNEDDDKEPPKGFEKFFKKKGDRKSAKKAQEDDDAKDKGKFRLVRWDFSDLIANCVSLFANRRGKEILRRAAGARR